MIARRALAGAALVGIVVGTFLPWVRSGQVGRNSYEAFGSLRRLIGIDGPLGAFLWAWPFAAIVCAVVAAMFILGFNRSAALVSLLPAVLAGGAAATVLRMRPNAFLRNETLGPGITLACSLILMIAAVAVLLPIRRRTRNREDAERDVPA